MTASEPARLGMGMNAAPTPAGAAPRRCHGSGATVWIADGEAPRCPHCEAEATVWRSSLGGGYRIIADH